MTLGNCSHFGLAWLECQASLFWLGFYNNNEASADDVEEVFDRGGGEAVRKEEGGRGTTGSKEEGEDSGTEH